MRCEVRVLKRGVGTLLALATYVSSSVQNDSTPRSPFSDIGGSDWHNCMVVLTLHRQQTLGMQSCRAGPLSYTKGFIYGGKSRIYML